VGTYLQFPTGPLAELVDVIWISEEYTAPH